LHPFASVGIGAAFNQAYGYSTNVPAFLTFTPQFASHQTTSFTYSVGLGMDFDVEKNWRLGANYRFTDLGKANLGAGNIDVFPFTSTLTQSHLYAQEVMAHVTYLFN
jgi:opacity protein-like surface antigen